MSASFFFTDTTTSEIYTLSLHDALPIFETLPAAEELTVEANPETVTPEVARALRGAGVTRVSLGAQTFQPRLLRSEEHTSELQSPVHLVCRLLLEKKKNIKNT